MKKNLQQGFTLVEVMVTVTVALIITSILIVNFSHSRTDLNNTVLTLTDSVRSAQAQALSGSLVAGAYRCGFGIHFLDVTRYVLYMGPDSTTVNCATVLSRNYTAAGVQQLGSIISLPNLALTFSPIPPDIFFEPPNPTTYINNVTTPGVEALIYIKNNASTNCPSIDCRIIHVSTSGLISTQ